MKTFRIDHTVLIGSISISSLNLANIIKSICHEHGFIVSTKTSGGNPTPSDPSPHHLEVRVRLRNEPEVMDEKILFRQSSGSYKTVSFLGITPIDNEDHKETYSLVSVDAILINDTRNRENGPSQILLSDLLIQGLLLFNLKTHL